MTASPAETPSVASRLRVSVQPAKSALPIRLLCEELPKFMCFLYIRYLRLFAEWDYLAPNIRVRVRFWVRVWVWARVRDRV